MLGNIIGKGRTANVYEYGEDKVVKLYFEGISEEFIKHELKINKIASENQVGAPMVYEQIAIEGQYGIIFEKITGKEVAQVLQKKPFMAKKLAIGTARAHARIHKKSSVKLENQENFFTNRIKATHELSEDTKKKIIHYMNSLPNGNQICHGDLHVGNYILNNGGYYAVDWTNAYSGNPASDIARSIALIDTPYGIENLPLYLKPIAGLIISIYRNGFLKEYLKNSDLKIEDINSWKLPVYAARLCENVPYEREWLLGLINDEIKANSL